MADRFFVTVLAPSQRELLKLREYDLDLFRVTAKETEQQEYSIDGLLTMEEVGRLTKNGYRVLVKEEASKQMRARTEVVEFQDWIKGMEE